jgi:hypothetical protein
MSTAVDRFKPASRMNGPSDGQKSAVVSYELRSAHRLASGFAIPEAKECSVPFNGRARKVKSSVPSVDMVDCLFATHERFFSKAR